MSLPRIVKGTRHTSLLITWKHSDDTVHDLQNATITGILEDVNGVARAIDGALAVYDGINGQFTWGFGALDTGTEGTFKCWFVATYADTFADKTYPEDFVVLPIGAP